MRKINTYILLAIALCCIGCVSLEQEPYDKIKPSKTFNTVNDAQMWVNGVYHLLREQDQGEPMYLTDVQADFLNLTNILSTIKPTLRDFHRWKEITPSTEQFETIWRNRFYIIANINTGLEGIEKMPNQDAVKVLKGELHLARAHCYTYLVTHYCKAYNPTTADTDLGLPIMNHFIIDDAPLRSSLKQTYEFILRDIAQAETLLAGVAGREGAETFTIDAVKALKARVLLYQNEWAAAYQTAKALIDTNKYPLVTTKNDLEGIWKDDTTKETIIRLHTNIGTIVERPTWTNFIYIDEELNMAFPFPSLPPFPPLPICGGNRQYLPTPNLIPTQDFVDLFSSSDWRKSIYIKEIDLNLDMPDFFGCPDPKDMYVVNKYPRNERLTNAGETIPYYGHSPILFRIAEQYLIAAEAAYRNNEPAEAQHYLNTLRHARGLTTSEDINTVGTALFTDIQNERNRELCFEGVRLYDLNRWGLGVRRGTPQNPSLNMIITDPANELHQLNLPTGYYKMVWPIPQAEIDYELGKWKQNPGW